MTNRKAPDSVMRDLCEASLEVDRIAGRAAIYGGGELGNALQILHKAQDIYRAATAPLRTRQEVDAEIVKVARATWTCPLSKNPLSRLCSEPTADEPTCYPTTAGCHWCGKVAPVTPVGWDNICAECLARGEKPSGSSSTPAAKESRDNAGVSAGPTNEPLEDPEPCSCDQALELQRIISHVRALALELVQVTEATPG